MKKLFYAVSLLLVLSLMLMIGSQALLISRADDVQVTMETLYGDPAAAAGVTTSMRATMDEHLYWDIRHTVGGNTDVDFFYSEERGSGYRDRPHFSLQSFSGMGMSSTGSIDLAEEEFGNMLRHAAALAEEVPKGEKRTKTYRLADFYDYYVIVPDIRVPSPKNNVQWILESQEEREFLNEYLKFPVLPDHMVQATVEKNAMDGVCDVNTQTVGEVDFHFGACSAYTDHGYYFSFSRFTSMDPIDVSHIRDGYGIYIIPLTRTDAGLIQRDENRDPVELATALPEDIDVMGIAANDDQTELYLLYGKEGIQHIDVYALPDMEKKQTIELPPHSYPDGSTVHMTDILVDETGLLLNGGSCMTFLAADSSGKLAVQTIGDYQTALNEYGSFYTWNGLDFSWNGERLAITYPMDYYESCSYYLLVFDAAGLVYTGKMGIDLNDAEAGSDTDRYHYQYDHRIRFDSINPYDDNNYLSVDW